MKTQHDTLVDLAGGTPLWFVLSTRALPLSLLGQFLSAGLALFSDWGLWDIHRGTGAVVGTMVTLLAVGTVRVQRLRGFGWWARSVALLYIVQAALAAGNAPPLLALHPVNGALLLAASTVLATKVERRLAHARRFAGQASI